LKRNPKELLDAAISQIKLDILVFGPSAKIMSSDERTRNLQNKRLEIRDRLVDQGHNATFAEDIIDSGMNEAHNNPFIQELFIMSEYDMIVNIVDSPGTIMEASVPARDPKIAQKTTLFLNEEYSEGLVYDACKTAELLGACFKNYLYPNDLIECHLLGAVMERVNKAILIKLLSSN